MREMAPDEPDFLLVIHDPKTAGQHVGIYGEHMDRLIYGETYEFDAQGNYTGRDHASDGELGQQIASSIYRIHFGDFGSHLIKVAYFFLGLILCVIISGGMNIYFLKSAERGNPKPRLEAAWSGLVWGSSALLALTLFLAVAGVGSPLLTPVFWVGLIIICLLAARFGEKGRAGVYLRAVTGLSLLTALAAHLIQYASTYSNAYILIVSIVLAFTGLLLLTPLLRAPFRMRSRPA
jgi:uncharacterized iron-regulated membrane protein